jgi:hypothetical protein
MGSTKPRVWIAKKSGDAHRAIVSFFAPNGTPAAQVPTKWNDPIQAFWGAMLEKLPAMYGGEPIANEALAHTRVMFDHASRIAAEIDVLRCTCAAGGDCFVCDGTN